MPRKKSVQPVSKRRGPKNTANQSKTLERVRQVEVDLHATHNINGRSYGPGKIKVRGDVARVLLEQERRASEHEERFYGRRAGMILPGPGIVVRLREVPYDAFDAHYLSNDAMPIGEASTTRFVPFGG